MRQIRRILLSSFVWLTAASTLIAGVPHFVCQCPRGQMKMVRVGAPAKKSQCCCGGQCCALDSDPGIDSDPTPNDAPATCCGQQTDDDRTLQPEGAGIHAQNDGCAQALVQPEPASFVQWRTVVTKDVAAAMPLTSEGPQSASPITAGYFHHPDHERPPPTNLLITLQHFLI